MIFSPLPKHKYKHCGYGIGNMNCSMEMWNLLSLSSRCLFGFENGCLSDRLAAKFDPELERAADRTILQELGEKRVRDYMRMGSPWEFYYALKKNPHDHLHLDSYHNFGLIGLVMARCMVWNPKDKKFSAEYVRIHSAGYQP